MAQQNNYNREHQDDRRSGKQNISRDQQTKRQEKPGINQGRNPQSQHDKRK